MDSFEIVDYPSSSSGEWIFVAGSGEEFGIGDLCDGAEGEDRRDLDCELDPVAEDKEDRDLGAIEEGEGPDLNRVLVVDREIDEADGPVGDEEELDSGDHDLDLALGDGLKIDRAGEPVGDEEERDFGDHGGDLMGDRFLYLEMAIADREVDVIDYGTEEEDRCFEGLDGELVPWSVTGKLKRHRMRKPGKIKRLRINEVKPGSIYGKHGFGRKHHC